MDRAMEWYSNMQPPGPELEKTLLENRDGVSEILVRPRGFEPLTFCSGGKRTMRISLLLNSQRGSTVLKRSPVERFLVP